MTKPQALLRFCLSAKAKMKMTLALVGLLLLSTTTQANHLLYYNTSSVVKTIFPQKVIPTTTTPPANQKYAAISYGPSNITGYMIPVLSFFDFTGVCTSVKSYTIPTLPNTHLYARCIVEDQSGILPYNLGYAIAGDYVTAAGLTGNFVIKTNQTGAVIWTATWTGSQGIKQVMISHDPANLNNVMIASMNSTPVGNTVVLYKLLPNGTALAKVSFTDPSSMTLKDAIEVNGATAPAAKKGYYLIADRQFGAVNTPTHIFQPWGTWSPAAPAATIFYYTALPTSFTYVTLVAMTKDELSTPTTPHIYMVGNTQRSTMPVFRPFLIDLNIVAGTWKYTAVDATGTTANEIITSTGITLENNLTGTPAVRNLMITCNDMFGNPSSQAIFAVPTTLVAAGRSIVKYSPPASTGLNNTVTNAVCSTYNTTNYTVIGCQLGSPLFTEFRVNWDGTLNPSPGCSTLISLTSTPATLGMAPHPTGSTTLLNWSNPAIPFSTWAWGWNFACGTTPPLGGIVAGGGTPPYTYTLSSAFSVNRASADYNTAYDQLSVATTQVVNNLNAGYLATTLYSGNPNFAINYQNTGQSQSYAVKNCANGDYLIGSVYTNNGANVLQLSRVDNIGNMIWNQHFDQSNDAVSTNIYVAEAVNGDAIIVASAVGSNNIIMARCAGTDGTTSYYGSTPITADGNNTENNTYVGGLIALPNNGYALTGSAGNNGDANDAFALACDANYSGTHTVDMSFGYKHYLANGYNLSNPGMRSNATCYGIGWNGTGWNGLGCLVLTGSTNDADQNGQNATYSNGLLIELGLDGTVVSANSYADNSTGQFITFNGNNVSGSNYIVTGSALDPSTGNTRTLLCNISSSDHSIGWAKDYGYNTINVGNCVFTRSDASGYVIAGISNDNSTSAQPIVISTDLNGSTGCDNSLSLTAAADVNVQPAIALGSATSATANSETIYPNTDNLDIATDCGGGALAVNVLNGSSGTTTATAKATQFKFYPNPTDSKLNVDLTALNDANGVVTIANMEGQQVSMTSVTLHKGANHLELDMTSLAPGIYTLKIVDDKNAAYPVSKIQKY